MISYASVDRIENRFVVMEVEKIPKSLSKSEDFYMKETFMADVEIEQFEENFFDVEEGDVFSVEHDGNNVVWIIQKDLDEKKRRIEIINKYQ